MAKAKKRSKKSLILMLIVEFIILLLIIIGIKTYQTFNKVIKQIPRDNSQDHEIIQNEEVIIDEGYRNIVIFGLDTRDNSLKRGNSDTIIIASINNKTKNVKLLSIYRDTYVNIPDIGYRKINAAYANGGYSLAINTINYNLDLNIKEYVTVNFKAVVDTIDHLGGITLDIQENELKYLNGYIKELNRINNTDVPGLTSAGTQTVNGTQATAYARIRYTSGGDFKRTERQRIVIQKIFEKVKSSKLSTIYSLIDIIFPQVSTNLSDKEIKNLMKDILAYDIVAESGFPFEKDAHTYNKQSYVFPINLADNVKKLHEFLFEETDYTPSSAVQDYSAYIEDIRTR